MASINSVYEKRFFGSTKSVTGKTYTIEIYDRKWSASGQPYTAPFPLEMTDEGMTISYDCEGDEKFAPIVGSKLSLNMVINNAATSGQISFLEDILGISGKSYLPYEEGDIFIVVKIGNSIIWYGEFLHDLDTMVDRNFPMPIQLTFTDGIGKLKGIDFQSENVDTTADSYNNQGHQKVAYWVGQVLQHTKHYKNQANPNGFWDDATNKVAFKTCIRWYNTSHGTYGSPDKTQGSRSVWGLTKCTVRWADKFNPSNGQRNIASAYEVLKQICRSWGCRVIFWNNHYYFVQIFEYSNPPEIVTQGNTWQIPLDQYAQRFYADGDFYGIRQASIGNQYYSRFHNTFDNIDHPGKRIQKLEGTVYKFLPQIKEVKTNLVHEGFQNIFPGFTQPGGGGVNANISSFQTVAVTNSTNYKFRTNWFFNLTTPSGWFLSSYTLFQFLVRVIAMQPGVNTLSAGGLATLSYDPVANTYGWDDTPGYTSSTDLGPVINLATAASGQTYTPGGTQTIPLTNLEFPGYRDADTVYVFIPLSPVYIKNQGGVSINIQTGNPYGSQAICTFGNPIDTTALQPPSWSTGFFNNYLSTIQPISTQSSATNTVFVNSQADSSYKLEWGDLFWGDGPEYWDDSALQVYDGSGWVFTDWNYNNWDRRDYTATTVPAQNTGYNFVELLNRQIKLCQSSIIKRASFGAINSVIETTNPINSRPFFINPIGVIRDCDHQHNGNPIYTRYFFRQGTFALNEEVWDGEWIETTATTSLPGSSSSRMAGAPNLNTPDGGQRNLLNQRQAPGPAQYHLLTSTEGITKEVEISSLAIAAPNLFNGDYQLGVDFDLKSGDKVNLSFPSNTDYCVTLTADVATDSTSISFEAFTPTYDSDGLVNISIPMYQLFEQVNRKTRGSIAGFDVSATSLTKGGISIDGFLDSDTMTGASATKLSTSESIKAYADTKQSSLTLTTTGTSGASTLIGSTLNIPNYATGGGSGGGITNYSMLTCEGTVQTSATTGAANGVVVPFDTELASTDNTIIIYGSSGAEGVENSQYTFSFGSETGFWEVNWNITTDTAVVNNRILTGIKLQQGQVADSGLIDFTDVNGSYAYIYDRGNGAVRKGSNSGSVIIKQNPPSDGTIYYRILIWKEAASNSSLAAVTVINGCQLTIKQLN
mgnify:CR=1 FL=1|tara:strand:+ start:13575 stop:17036 length:3462 start_codon:yes stop_codon:yes gene_type:complete